MLQIVQIGITRSLLRYDKKHKSDRMDIEYPQSKISKEGSNDKFLDDPVSPAIHKPTNSIDSQILPQMPMVQPSTVTFTFPHSYFKCR